MDTTISSSVRAGSLAELREAGHLLTKVDNLPVVVFWHADRAWAIEDRCPHLGFPLHRGTVESGLVTCHWHHARFDLESGCTLDLWADDAHGFDVELRGDDVVVAARPESDPVALLQARLRDGLEEGLSLVVAKAVLGLLAAGAAPAEIVRTGIEFGIAYRAPGWGAGLTVLVAMANELDALEPEDQAAALIHALVFVSRDTRGNAPKFAVGPLRTTRVPPERLEAWYRRFVDTRSSDAAERVLETALGEAAAPDDLAVAERMMFAAVTDHVFIDGGHAIDFTNKGFEGLELVGHDQARAVLPTLVPLATNAMRSEESGEWQHPHDLVALVARASPALADALAQSHGEFTDVSGLAHRFLGDDPEPVVDALLDAANAGATGEQLARALAFAAALRITRFHTQNDFGDWDTVHHTFTAANALHHAIVRQPTPELARGLVHGVLRVHLDRFLNVPPARLPSATAGDLIALSECWEVQGEINQAGEIAWGYLHGGGSRAELVAALGHALLAEDAEFHWYQVYEAAARQSSAWPEGSDESALILAGLARFLAAHTPTRRELPTIIRTATRLRRGESLFEET